MDNLSIKINIGGRVYPLTIDPREEESIRRTAESINKNIKDLQNNYAVRDMQDLLAMTCLQFATDVNKEHKTLDYSNLLEDVELLNNNLNQLI